jgi:copper chaperone CopZ
MKTVHCVRAVFQALAGVPGVTRAEVQPGRAEIEVVGPLSEEALAHALDMVGYRLTGVRPAPRTLPLLGGE